jgi:hypothetical protein
MTKHKNTSSSHESHSSYWLDDSTNVFNDTGDTTNTLERTMKLAAIRRATSNFVRILTGDPSIKIKYSSGKESYTDGKTVVISADDNPAHFDSMVGLALHEGSHCLLSDFGFLRAVQANHVFYNAIHPTLRKMLPMAQHHTDPAQADVLYALRQYIQFIMNVIEDRRIDSYVYRMAAGYRPYYDALYQRYFFNRDTENNLRRNPDWRIPTVENYINWLVCMFSPHFKPRAMRGLAKMVKLIDLPNIRRFDKNATMVPLDVWQVNEDTTYAFDQFSPLWKVANLVMIEILRHVQFEAKKSEQQKFKFGDTDIDISGLDEDTFEDIDELENLDSTESGKFNADRGQKGIEKIKVAIGGNIKKKKLRRGEKEQIDSMESAAAKIVESSDAMLGRQKIPCLVTRSLTKQIIHADWFPFVRHHYKYGGQTVPIRDSVVEDGVLKGVRMGAILAQRLSVRNDTNITHFTRQQQGKIDRRILAQLGMDIESVFKRTTVDQYNPVMLYLSLDASGSMYGAKWKNTITVATALAYAAERIRNLDVIISLRGDGKNLDIPCVSVVYDSRTDNFKKARELFPYLSCNGSTPEGLCYTATMDLIQECATTHTTYFINFSDGEPGAGFRYNGQYFNYGGDIALRHTRNMVRQIREAGIKVLSYFITEVGARNVYSKNAFTAMYGPDAEFVNVQNVTEVLKTLNKLLLVRG